MKIKVKVLYDEKYKTPEHCDEAIERFEANGWIVADTVYSVEEDANAIIFYKLVERKE